MRSPHVDSRRLSLTSWSRLNRPRTESDAIASPRGLRQRPTTWAPSPGRTTARPWTQSRPSAKLTAVKSPVSGARANARQTLAYAFGKPFALCRCNDRDGRRSTMRLREHHERTAPLAETCPRRPARLLTCTRVVRRHLAGRCAMRVLPQQGGETTSSTREKLQRQLSLNSSVRSALATHHENISAA